MKLSVIASNRIGASRFLNKGSTKQSSPSSRVWIVAALELFAITKRVVRPLQR
jgi:hypothetical protein